MDFTDLLRSRREIEISHSDISWDVTQELCLYRDLNVQQRN